MANEIVVTMSLRIQKPPTYYQSQPTTFQANFSGSRGPVPGTVLIATTPGTDVPLTALSAQGGWAFLENLGPPGSVGVGGYGPTTYVTYGIQQGSNFYPLGELLPGEGIPIRLSRLILAGSGAGAQTLRFIANNVAQIVLCEAFDQ